MAISELTKRLSLQERNRLQERHNRNVVDAEAMEAQATALRNSNKEIEKDIAALKKDIPDPKPVT